MRSKKNWLEPDAQKTGRPPTEQLVVADMHREKITQQLEWCASDNRCFISLRACSD
jgi:hypothetical protein